MRLQFKVVFWAGVICLFTVFLISAWSIMRLHEVTVLRANSFYLQNKLDDALHYLEAADNSFLAAKISDSEEGYKQFLNLIGQAKKEIDQLSRLQGQTDGVKREILNLQELIEHKIEVTNRYYFQNGIFLKPHFKNIIEIKNDLVLTNTVRERIQVIDQMLDQEIRKHETFVGKYFNLNLVILLFAVVISFSLFFLFSRLVSEEIQKRAKLVADLRQAQDAAIVGSNLKSQFLATVSHEIRTPLNGIIGMSDLIRSGAQGNELKRYADVIYSSGQSLLRIVNDILDFSKIEANKIEFELQEIKLIQLLNSSVELFSKQAAEKKLSIVFSPSPILNSIVATDGTRLTQVLHNLIGNAVKFTDAGGIRILADLEIKKSDDKAWLTVRIQDTGPGIPEDKQELLFQPFNQLHNSHRHEGTGLGLVICKRIIEKMNGEIGLNSQMGKGTEFWFRVPVHLIQKIDTDSVSGLQLNGNHVAPQVEKLDAPTTIGDRLILLVEDNPTNQLLAQTQLEKIGFRVHVVNNGLECIEAISRIKYDLILMDCRMPVMDGYDATRRIREEEKSKHTARIPIIAMTANAISGEREKCISNGMDDYISKPFDIQNLKQVIDRWLKTKPVSVDWGVLRSLEQKTNRDVVLRLIQSYISTLQKSLQKIHEAKEPEEISSLAHQLKSSSAALGALEFSKLCETVEEKLESELKLDSELKESLLASGQIVLSEFQNQKIYESSIR